MPITSDRWQSCSWKNELDQQKERIANLYSELNSDDFDGPHNPMHMLDRAIIIAAIAIRRLCEKKLITDKLSAARLLIRTFLCKNFDEYRTSFLSDTGGMAFNNYDFDKPKTTKLTICQIANEIIHASQLMYVYNEETVPTGLLIASDHRMKLRLLHFTYKEFEAVINFILNDTVVYKKDWWDPETGEIHATRE